MAEETTAKKAKKVYTLEDIRFKEENKTMAILACIPIVGLVLLFVEKEDQFVRYMGAQYTVAGVVPLVSAVLMIIPIINIIVAIFNFFYWFVLLALIIMGMVKVSKGERFDAPVFSGLGLKLMSAV